MVARIKTWWTILRICLDERLVYRGDFALGTLMRFLPIVTQIFLWGAIFTSVRETTGDSSDEPARVAGFTNHELIAYYLLTMVVRAFSSMPGLASGIALQIRTGEIKKFLIQPIDMLGFLLLNRLAHKLVYYTVAAGPFALVFYLCRGYFTTLPDLTTFLAFLLSLVLSFLLGFFLEATLGMIGFWFLEVSSLLFVYMLISFYASGHMFPITMLEGFWGDVVNLLPLKYLAFSPAAIFLGKVPVADLPRELGMQLAWVLFFIVASRVALARGLKRYSGFGG